MGAERRHSSQGPRWNVTGPLWHFRVVRCMNLTSAHHVSARIAGGSNDISMLTIPHFFLYWRGTKVLTRTPGCLSLNVMEWHPFTTITITVPTYLSLRYGLTRLSHLILTLMVRGRWHYPQFTDKKITSKRSSSLHAAAHTVTELRFKPSRLDCEVFPPLLEGYFQSHPQE